MPRRNDIAKILMIAAGFALIFSAGRAERPRIAAAGLCGVVTDLQSKPIEKATVTATFGNSSTSQETDKAGNWSFGRGVGPHWMEVEGSGYQTFQFDYIEKGDQKNGRVDNSAFLSRPKGEPCAAPIYVRLAPLNRKAGLVTLDASKGVHKEKKTK